MNIREAKTEIKNTVRAYTRKDEKGRYRMKAVRQRPVLLIGPPGIGKTAIMEQIAAECGIGLVAYTITHHTRQSAIGLPVVVKKEYQGQEYTVTEYTMSEIIASVYECMEKTGCQEGILFIDEINCVSETLTPTMLQFLQCKTFGSHKVPEGWVIVAAGNPTEYNKSAKEFDIVTLDRVKRIDVAEDVDVWLAYAQERRLHPAVIAYLRLKKEHFYVVKNTAKEKTFVTARGWEDLSELLYQYEEMAIPVTVSVIGEYLQKKDIAEEFENYYILFCHYRDSYDIAAVLDGKKVPGTCPGTLPVGEQITIVNLLAAGLGGYFREWKREQVFLEYLTGVVDTCLRRKEPDLAGFIKERRDALAVRMDAWLIEEEEADLETRTIGELQHFETKATMERITSDDKISFLKRCLAPFSEQEKQLARRSMDALENAFAFMEAMFGEGMPMHVFVEALSCDADGTAFLKKYGCEAYFTHSDSLLYTKKRWELLERIGELTKE